MMLSICKQIFELWNQSGVRYCHWKSNEHLLEGLTGDTDLDIYVDPNDKTICERGLKECLYIILKPQKSSQYFQVDEWIGLDEETGKMVHVHLHYRLITGTKFCKEYTFPLGDLMLSTRVLNSEFNVYTVAPELEIIILFSRIVLKAKSRHNISAKGYEKEINYLKKESDLNIILKNCISLLGEKDGQFLYSNIIKNKIEDINWSDVYKIVKQWLKKWKNRSGISCWFRSKYYWFRLYFDLILNKYGARIINKKVFPIPALSIAFIGQDGSGKSTIVRDISKWLNWKISSHAFYLGTGDGYHSPWKSLLRILNKANKKRVHKQVSQAKSTTNKDNPSLKKQIGIVLTCIHLSKSSSAALKKVKQAKKYIEKGGIALYDRFPQNQFNGIYDGPKIRHIYGSYKGIIRKFVNYYAKREERNIGKIIKFTPNVVFKLTLPPEESIRRKPFENYDIVKQKSEITKALEFPNSKVFTIDATQNYDSELILIKKHLWDLFLKLQ